MPSFRNASSYRRSTALLSSRSVVAGIVLLALAFVLLILQVFAPNVLPSVASPFWRIGNGATSAAASFGALFGNAPELARERDRLADENLTLNEENRTLRAQLADFRTLAGDSGTGSGRIIAGVLARPPVSPYDTLVVAAGTQQGVKEGAYAYATGGVPIGTVAKVTDTSATIELFSAGGRSTDGWVGENRIPITLTGRGAGAFDATLPRESGIASNTVVYLPGPGALPVGTVVRVDSDPSSPRATVHIAPYVNLFSLAWVEIAP